MHNSYCTHEQLRSENCVEAAVAISSFMDTGVPKATMGAMGVHVGTMLILPR